MKTKIIIFIVLVSLSVLFLNSINAINNSAAESSFFNPGKKFIITAMHSGFDTSGLNYSRLTDTLKFNFWHRYGGWFSGDSVFANTSAIAQGVTDRLSQNNQRNLRTIFQRPVTTYASYGQRSDYQAEKINELNDYWFHSYNTSIVNVNDSIYDINDTSPFGSNQSVKYCRPIHASLGINAQYIIKDLRSNREQCNRVIDHTRDDKFAWFVKPSIRIDTAFANNLVNQNDSVCRIDIFNWNGTLVKSVNILVRYFKSNVNRYSGEYLEEFFFTPSASSAINLTPTELCPNPIKNSFDWVNDTIKTDFRVYWYGRCEMWLDYVRVENEPSKQLFDGLPLLINAIEDEVNLAMSNYNSSDPIPNNFYNEEFEFNMSPCTQRVSQIIDSVSQGKLTIMVNLNMQLYNAHNDSCLFFILIRSKSFQTIQTIINCINPL